LPFDLFSRDLSPAAEACAERLETILHGLRALRLPADEAHELLERGLAPDVAGCVPDELADFEALVEAHMVALGARVPA
jgi:hypothetical protein